MAIGGMQRKLAKQQMKKLMGGDLVSDRETRQMQEKAQGVAEAGLQAQQSALARSQQQMAGGAPVQKGAMAQSQGALAKASADAAVKASGQAQDMAAALTEKRKGQALALGQEMYERNQRWADFGLKVVESAAQIPGLLGSGGALSAVGNAFGGRGLVADDKIDETIQFQ